MEVIPPNDFQFEFSTSMLHTTPEWMARVEAGEAPRNLIDLQRLGRLAVRGESDSYISNSWDIVPLNAILLLKDHDLIKRIGYEHLYTRTWSPEDCIRYGHWLNKITGNNISMGVIINAFNLGLGPSDQGIRRNRFSSMGDYYDACNITTKREGRRSIYALWTDQQLADHAERVFLAWKKKNPDKGGHGISMVAEIDRWARAGRGPGMKIYQREGRSLMRIMALNGYVEARNLSPTECIKLGREVARANAYHKPTEAAFDFLAQFRRTPTSRHIQQLFGWDNFLEEIEAEFHRGEAANLQVVRKQAAAIRNEVAANKLPDFVIEGAPDQEIISRRARWLIVNDLYPIMDMAAKRIIVQFTPNKSFGEAISASGYAHNFDILMSAERLGVVQDIWPNNGKPFLKYLKVPEELLGQSRYILNCNTGPDINNGIKIVEQTSGGQVKVQS